MQSGRDECGSGSGSEDGRGAKRLLVPLLRAHSPIALEGHMVQ